MSKSVPDRWLEYKPYGEVIKGTKILAFKVPLREGISRNLEYEDRFTPTILLQDFPGLKCIVDLTNTFRYYDKWEFTNAGVKYEKIMIPGREIPPKNLVAKFFETMRDFTSSCAEDELVGVHCTHGINRTGYLICRYLMEQLGWKMEDSLTAFNEARGYPIERDVYLNDLKNSQPGERLDTIRFAPTPYSMGPPVFAPPRRYPTNDLTFPPEQVPFDRPSRRWGRMPPPGPLYGPRPHRYLPMRRKFHHPYLPSRRPRRPINREREVRGERNF